MTTYIDFSAAPEDPVQRIIWIGGLNQALRAEIDAELQRSYFEARLQGVLSEAIDLRLHSRKRIMAWTRHENEARGRVLARWNDGLS